jgi:hypothetical protein
MNRRNFLKTGVLFGAGSFVFRSNYTGKIFITDDYEIKKCRKKLSSLDLNLKDKNIDYIIPEIGKSFIGTEYVAGTLDVNTKKEELVIKITGLDCVTFVENTLVMSRLIQKNDTSFEAYKNELTLIRYRKGIIDGYTSRLHYFTDWIYDNQQKGIVKDVTEEIGGIPYDKTINFMSTHKKSYKQLLENSDYVDDIKETESEITKRNKFYIPKNKVDKYYDYLKTGDIIATTTEIDGLDVTHTGFIYKENEETYFMHASIVKKEVTISNVQLKEYLLSNKKQSGIIVSRPQNI